MLAMIHLTVLGLSLPTLRICSLFKQGEYKIKQEEARIHSLAESQTAEVTANKFASILCYRMLFHELIVFTNQ